MDIDIFVSVDTDGRGELWGLIDFCLFETSSRSHCDEYDLIEKSYH